MPDRVCIQSSQHCYKSNIDELIELWTHIAVIDYFTWSGREILEFIKIIAVGKKQFLRLFVCIRMDQNHFPDGRSWN